MKRVNTLFLRESTNSKNIINHIMKVNTIFLKTRYLLVLLSVLITSCQTGFNNRGSIELDKAKVTVSGSVITATTGTATRIWKLTDMGLSTESFTAQDMSELLESSCIDSDWQFPWMEDETEAQLISVKNEVDNDEGFLNNFIRTTVEFEYPISQVGLIYDIWTLPGAPGFRTEISIKKLNKGVELDEFALGTVEALSLKDSFVSMEAIGYFNDTQHRNTLETPILKREKFELNGKGSVDWTNAAIISNGKSGVILVKESHKCANQQGVNTGGINFRDRDLAVTGAGLDTLHLSTEYQSCWATWSIAYQGGEESAKLALKQFDRSRYPIDSERDIYIMSNTWGSGSSGSNSKYASREENIIRELEVSKELGLDLLQIDDGWQGTQYSEWETVPTAIYRAGDIDVMLPDSTEYKVYPEGWQNVRSRSEELGVKLGLWAASHIPYEDLIKNYELGNFCSYKLDFARLTNYKILHDFESKVREFIIKTGHKVRVNWDVTENPPRIGYYFGREYGNIYLENRKPMTPINVVYHPWLVLRDAWHVAKYTNINKFQITYQNVTLVNREVSDAYRHSHDYALAITLMGSPIFFQELHLLSSEAKAAIKPLISNYKMVREEMYEGYVFAIGEEPTNASITGFQNYNPETESGYITLFREINCAEENFSIPLNFIKGESVKFKNLMSGEEWKIDNFEMLEGDFSKAGDYRFISYEVI